MTEQNTAAQYTVARETALTNQYDEITCRTSWWLQTRYGRKKEKTSDDARSTMAYDHDALACVSTKIQEMRTRLPYLASPIAIAP
jgi:hypothetical protein